MNSRVPFVAEVGLEAPAQRREALGQLPALEGPGEVERTGLSLQEGQVVDAGRRTMCSLPQCRRWRATTSVPLQIAHLFDPADDGDLVVGIGGRHRVVVAVETHEGERVGMTLHHPAGLEGLGRQRQHGGAVFISRSALVLGLAPDPAEQVGVTALRRGTRSARPTRERRNRDQQVAPRVADVVLDVALLVAPSHPAEVVVEEVVALEAQELPGELPLGADDLLTAMVVLS